MTDLYLIERSDLSFSQLMHLLEEHRIDTVVDGRPSDEPGDFSFAVLGALCSAFGYGYLRRGEQLMLLEGEPERGEPIVGSLRTLASEGRVAILTGVDSPSLDRLADHGIRLLHLDPENGIVGHEPRLPLSDDQAASTTPHSRQHG